MSVDGESIMNRVLEIIEQDLAIRGDCILGAQILEKDDGMYRLQITTTLGPHGINMDTKEEADVYYNSIVNIMKNS